MQRRTALLISFLLLNYMAGRRLAAQSFFGAGVSAQTAANGGIYIPSSNNVSDALAINPAGLTALSAPTVNLSAAGIFAHGSFSNLTNTNSPMQTTAGVIPFGAFGMPLGHSRWTIGAGFTPDLLSSANWRYKDAPGAAGANYGLQTEKSAILAFRSSAGIGFSISPNLAIGASVGAVYNSNTLDAPYIFQSQPVVKGLKTLLDLKTGGTGWDASLGIRTRVSRRVEFAASYRTETSIVSSGSATGNLNAQFAALGITANPAFAYRAQVKVVLPQSALASLVWQADPKLRLSVEGDWTDWYHGFQQLPVTLTKGTNALVNSLLNSDSLFDSVPLNWKQQFTVRSGVERMLGENLSVSAGFSHANNPVPNSTLSPLTAAIMQNSLSTGIGFTLARCRFDLYYGVDLTAHSEVNSSGLLLGEYSHSKVSIGTQSITLSTSFHL